MKLSELIELAKLAPAKSSKATESVNDVHRFLRLFKVKDGAHKIRREVLWQAFNMWQPNMLTDKEFFKQASKLLQVLVDGQGKAKHYLINYKPLELLNRVDNFMRG